MSPDLSEILRSGFIVDSSLRRRTHLVQSFSVAFLYCFFFGFFLVFKNHIFMATSSGNSSGSSQIQNIASDKNLLILMNERKRKRMESNRESARRSRMRKQKHLDNLMAQVSQLKKDNNQIMTSVSITTQHYMNVEAENSVLRAQMIELTQRLQSLNEIINFMNTSNNVGRFENEEFQTGFDSLMMMNNDPWNLGCLNQPAIMTSADIFQY
ncbi:hypothetical protein Leryth_010587 [Lithospermum erythrorhizon]|nr:hypothetical protein Leryth_010587 [Lithospermum erythrorhizon]